MPNLQTPIPTPTPEQMAHLHALLARHSELARKNNFTLTTLLWTGGIKILECFDGEAAIKYLKECAYTFFNSLDMNMNEETKYYVFTGILFSLLVPTLYTRYKVWGWLSDIALKIFPSGFFAGIHALPQAVQAKHRLNDSATVNTMIAELTTLNKKLDAQYSYNYWATLLLSIIIPLFARLSVTQTAEQEYQAKFAGSKLALSSSSLGVYFQTINPYSLLPSFLTQLANNQQSIMISYTVYSWWTNYNLPKQFKSFLTQLQNFTLVKRWQLHNQQVSAKTLALFKLHLNTDNQISVGEDSQDQVSAVNYICELHQTLLEFDIPVYVVADDLKIYVGHHNLTERTCNRIKAKLTKRLQAVAIQERAIEHELMLLNQLTVFRGLRTAAADAEDLHWDYYLERDVRGNSKLTYFFDLNTIRRDLWREFFISINQVSGLKAEQNNHILLLPRTTSIATTPAQKELICQAFGRVVDLYNQNLVTQKTGTELECTQPKLRRKGASVAPATTSTEPVVEAPLIPQAQQIQFSQNYYYNLDEQEHNTPNPYLVYPLIIAGLANTTLAFAGIDPAVYPHVSKYLDQRHIIDTVKRGKVLGMIAGSKSKAGAKGIIRTNQPYQTVHGRNISNADLKLKFPNNIRIFGRLIDRRIVAGRQCILYLFDGASFAH